MTREDEPLPPVEEVHALWRHCNRVQDDDSVSPWAEDSKLDSATLDRYGLVRAIPFRLALPPWARGPGEAATPQPWNEIGARLVVPLFDEAGEMRSLRARALLPFGEQQARWLHPAGFGSAGLVLANPLAVMMVQIAAWRASSDPLARVHGGDGWPEWAERRLLIVDGEQEFLHWSCHPRAHAFAVLGTGSAAWSEAIAYAVPDHTTVLVRTGNHDVGDRYAERIAESLGERCSVRESEPLSRAERRRLCTLREHEHATATRPTSADSPAIRTTQARGAP